MEENINTIEDLKELVSRSCHIVEPCNNRKGKSTAKIPIHSYAELSYFLMDAIKMSIAALDAEHEEVTAVSNVSSAVSGVLEKLLDVIPLEEMNLLDKIREMVTDNPPDEKG